MIVADASVVLNVISGEPGGFRSLLLSPPVAAPDILDVEVMSGLRRLERRRQVTPERAQRALADLDVMPVVRHPSRVLVGSAWELRDNLTAYGALYVVLARRLSATLVTADRRMAKAARAMGVAVA